MDLGGGGRANAQRELLFPYTHEDEFILSPGGRAQASKFLDEAMLFGCGHQPHMRVSTLSAPIPRLLHLRAIPSAAGESFQR